MRLKSNKEIILDLEREIKLLKKFIITKDILIDNYKIIVDGYKKIVNDQNNKSEDNLKIVEIDLKNNKKIMEAFLISEKRNLKLKKIIKGFQKNNDYKSRLN